MPWGPAQAGSVASGPASWTSGLPGVLGFLGLLVNLTWYRGDWQVVAYERDGMGELRDAITSERVSGQAEAVQRVEAIATQLTET